MIIGIGSDLSDIRRIEQTLKKFGARFEERVFTERERGKARSRKGAGEKTVASTYAKRFAAKEACSKALGTGMRDGVAWRDIEVTNLPSGAPTITLHGKALKHLANLTPSGHTATIWLTMTDEYPLAQAFVIISAEK